MQCCKRNIQRIPAPIVRLLPRERVAVIRFLVANKLQHRPIGALWNEVGEGRIRGTARAHLCELVVDDLDRCRLRHRLLLSELPVIVSAAVIALLIY